ncbi:trypco2 family protein [Streptomyces sp. NPDC000151]|uniref:trypco2 family protein n=1 Tax=Streptomyces sp. NPDC000151 TaxID=3154244 RepID=UPI003324FB1A
MKIPLADAVAALRDELLEAVGRGAGQDLAFKVGPVELEFTVELREDVKAKGGFTAWVVSAGAEAGVARGDAQRVMVTLTPQGPGGGDLLVHGDSERRGKGPGPTSAYERGSSGGANECGPLRHPGAAGVLIFDETGDLEKGQATAGVGRQCTAHASNS